MRQIGIEDGVETVIAKEGCEQKKGNKFVEGGVWRVEGDLSRS
jgi:hypothetical protein